MENQLLETERLILRPFMEEDIEPTYQMNLDPEVSKYTGDGGVVDRAEIERRITEDVMGDYRKHGFGRLAVTLKTENILIGFCGLKYLDDLDVVDLGYRLNRNYWGQGFATEAAKVCLDFGFKKLNLSQIIGLVLPENIASIRVLDKLGFRFEKEFEQYDLLVRQYARSNLERDESID